MRVLHGIIHEPRADYSARIAAVVAMHKIGGLLNTQLSIDHEITHRYVVEMPSELTEAEWIQEYSPPMMIEAKNESNEE